MTSPCLERLFYPPKRGCSPLITFAPTVCETITTLSIFDRHLVSWHTTVLERSERRRWGDVYVRGLLGTSRREATATMATRVSDGNVQAMQQFIGQSPWPGEPLRQLLAQRLVTALQPVAAWVIDDTGFPKKGTHAVG